MRKFTAFPLFMAFAVSPAMADFTYSFSNTEVNSESVCNSVGGEWVGYINGQTDRHCLVDQASCEKYDGVWRDTGAGNYHCFTEGYCLLVDANWDPVNKTCFYPETGSDTGGGSGSGNSGSGTGDDSSTETETGGGTGSGNSGSGSETGGGSGSGSTSSGTRFRVAQATHEASATTVTSGQYVKGAYNANVGNINTALTYVEDSAVETINNATVSANNLTLSVNGFTPSGSVSVDSTKATITGTVNVPTTVPALDTWGSTSTTNATLTGTGTANINSGATLSGVTASFTGTASGNLTGSGSFNNAKVSVDDWYPVNPQ